MIQEPVQPTISDPAAPSGPPSPRRRSGLRMAVLIVAGMALAIPVIAITAAPRNGAATLAAGASASAKASDDHDTGRKKDKGLKDVGRGGKFTGNGNGNGRLKGNGYARGPITIRAIGGSQISIATEDGWTRTIVATSATVITKGGQPIAVGDLHVGDRISFRQTRNADGSYAITAIAVVVPTAAGEVTAVDGSSITIRGRAGVTRVITVTDATVYQLGKAPGSKADVKVGVHVTAQGATSGDTFTATIVRVSLKAPKAPRSSAAPGTSAKPD